MGHLKDIANQPKIQTFPSSTFEVAGEVPASQCSEAQIESIAGVSLAAPFNRVDEAGKFAGYNLVGKICHITASVGGNTGDFGITFNGADSIFLDADPGDGDPVTYYISNGGELILTRNVQSFAEFITAAGYAYTIKGGKLYTTMPSSQLQNACTILFAPIT